MSCFPDVRLVPNGLTLVVAFGVGAAFALWFMTIGRLDWRLPMHKTSVESGAVPPKVHPAAP